MDCNHETVDSWLNERGTPVLWMCKECRLEFVPKKTPKRWIGLNEKDLIEIKVRGPISYKWVKTAEAKLKEKNDKA